MLVSGTAVIAGYAAAGATVGSTLRESITYDLPNPVLAYTSLTQSISASHDAEKVYCKDRDGNDTTVICCNEGYKITIHIIPADTVANSIGSAIAQCRPPRLASGVTLANFVIPWINGSSWVYLGGATFDLDNSSNPVRMNLPIEYRTATDLSAVVIA